MWKPISELPDYYKQQDFFLARWKDVFGEWEYCIAYYGQFGNCYPKTPTYMEICQWEVEGTNKRYTDPEIFPEEWMDIER
jgi:hypothetical protein